MANPVLYVWVDPLSDMNPGKAMAHSGHAASQFVNKMHRDRGTPAERKQVQLLFNEWIAGDRGFGTQINLWARDREDWQYVRNELIFETSIFEKWKAGELEWGAIMDPTYPFMVNRDIAKYLKDDVIVDWNSPLDLIPATRPENTAFWLFCDKDDEDVAFYLQDFELQP